MNAPCPSGTPPVRIELLGSFRVTIADHTIPDTAWQQRKATALVKLLALVPGQVLHRDQVLDLPWPNLAPTAAHNLRYALHIARNILEGPPTHCRASSSSIGLPQGTQFAISATNPVRCIRENFDDNTQIENTTDCPQVPTAGRMAGARPTPRSGRAPARTKRSGRMSTIRYSTFLIRHWHFSDQHERIEIQHIQSGATQRLDSLGAILDWMAARDAQLAVPPEQQAPDGAARDSDLPADG